MHVPLGPGLLPNDVPELALQTQVAGQAIPLPPVSQTAPCRTGVFSRQRQVAPPQTTD